MKCYQTLAVAALLVANVSMPSTAVAHSRMASSTPAQGSTVSAPRVITMNFSEALLPPTAVASIVMTAMPGVKNHGEMVIRNFTPAWSNANKTLTLTLRQPLKTGAYDVRWQAAGADGHRMTGKISFTVR